jgi:hypothetical protein
MTHGHEKSDSAIVAGKPTNKVEQSAAEPVEPRAEAEGNASQQSTCRAQDRISVSQALDRIRQVARVRKKEKFTALFHHLTIDLLEDAFDDLKEDAAAGVDGRNTMRTSSAISRFCMRGSIEERTGRYQAGGCTYRSRTVGSARSRSLLSKTKLSRGRRPRC